MHFLPLMDAGPLDRNTRYTTVAKCLHWAIAALILGAYCSIYYREWLTYVLRYDRIAIQVHYSCGILVAALVVLRIAWRWRHRPPAPRADTIWHRRAVRLGHAALYAVMIVMPITGYLTIADFVSTGKGHVDFLLLFELDFLRNVEPLDFLGLSLAQLEDPAHRIHAFIGAWIAWLLIAGHAAATFYHQHVKKDGTLDRMTFDWN